MAAVGVAGKGEFYAELRSTIKRVWIMGEQNVWHVAADERLDADEARLAVSSRLCARRLFPETDDTIIRQ